MSGGHFKFQSDSRLPAGSFAEGGLKFWISQADSRPPRSLQRCGAAVEPLLPSRAPDTHPLDCHRRRIADRDCFHAILLRLVTGCSWDVAARLSTASETTLRRRRDEWVAAGVFDALVDEAIAAYDRILGLDLSEVCVDGSLHKAPCGGQATGPNHRPRQAGLEVVADR